MKFKAIVEYDYPIEHKPPVKAEIVLHGDRVITDNIKWLKDFKENKDVLDKIRAEIEQTADEEQKHDKKWAIGLRYAVKIIDKYKAESEK